MYGRYGMDQLNIALLILGFILALINGFGNSYVLSAIVTVILFYEIFRAFSRKIYVRRKENNVFMRFWAPVGKWLSTRYTRYKERGIYRYRTCPGCKATLRLPAKKGKHTAKGPKCGKEFNVKI